jgi:hypothetical protein
MKRIFGIKSDIGSIIKMTEEFLANLHELQKQKGKVTLNPNYATLLNKLYNSPDVMLYNNKK